MAIPANHFWPLPHDAPAVALLDSLPDFEHFPWLMEEASEPDKLVEFARRYLASLADSPPSRGNLEPALSNSQLRGQKAGSAGFVRDHPRTADILRLSSECAKVGWPDEVGAQLDVRQKQLLKQAPQRCNHGGVSSPDQLMEATYAHFAALRQDLELERLVREAIAFSQSIDERLASLTVSERIVQHSMDADLGPGKLEGGSNRKKDDYDECAMTAVDKKALKDALTAKYGDSIARLDPKKFQKEKKAPLPAAACAAMKAEYARNKYPSATWMQEFADDHRLTKTQVTNWFNNERKRRPEAGGAAGKVAKRRTRVSASLKDSEEDLGDEAEEVVFVEEKKRTARGRNEKGQSELIVDTSRFSRRDPETTFFRRN